MLPSRLRVELSAWFMRWETLNYLSRRTPSSWTNGEDIHLAAMAQIHGGLKCYVPPHPWGDRSLWGSIRGNELGDDAVASWKRRTYAVHKAERDEIVKSAIGWGWRPLFMRDQA